MSDTLTITVQTIHRGQPRPYADHYFESVITYDRPFAESVPRAHSKVLVEPWEEEGKGNWASGRLLSIEAIAPEQRPAGSMIVSKSWRVKITRAYTD